MTTEPLGFIGLGAMGAGMAANLLRAGHTLTVFDANPDAVARLVAEGATGAASPAGVADRASRVFLCLPFAPEVRTVMFGDAGLAGAGRDGLHVVDCTTLIRSDALAIAAEASRAGIDYNDCPVSGGPPGAGNGTLTVMFGGTAAQFDATRPYLEHIGNDIVHCGPLGAGQLMKAINNVVYDVNIAALCEMLPLAVKAGLDPETVASVLTSGSSRSFASERFVPRILDRRFDADFPLASAWKDIVNVQQVAVEHGAMTPVINAMTAVYQSTMAEGLGGEPKSAMVKMYERVLGLEVRRTPHD